VSTIVDSVRGLIGRRADLSIRLEGLDSAVEAADGRLDPSLLAETRAVTARAGQRLRLSAEHTVVGVAGATGSGKSSLFNALCGIDIATVGVRRPTTSSALACVWSPDDAEDLLDWLDIPPRNRVSRANLNDTSEPDSDHDLRGLVLLDLPDHDSVEVSHHLEVERLVRLVDVLVWVLDPQKYADAAIHDRFLRPLASHAEVMFAVLNQVDRLTPTQRDSCLDDISRLLAADGLSSVPIFATSATRGDGLTELRRALAARVAAKKAARDRLAADITAAAGRLAPLAGEGKTTDVARGSQGTLVDTFAEAAGVPVVVRAVRKSAHSRARQATGWPVTRWLGKLRPDPLRRLHLDRRTDPAVASIGRSSLPTASPVQRARVDTEVRRAVDATTQGMPKPWVDAVRRASLSRSDDLSDALDQAVSTTDLGAAGTPLWWRLVRTLQWVLFGIAVAGGVWLAALAGMGYLRLPQPDTPRWYGFPAPTFLLLGGIIAGILVAVLARLASSIAARRRAAATDRRLRAGIVEVTEQFVIEPIEAELAAYQRFRGGVQAALHR